MAISCNYNFIHPIQYLYYSEILFYMVSQENIVGILTRQWVEQLRNHDASPSKGKRIFLLQSNESCSRAGSTSYSVSNQGGSCYRNTSGQCMKQTTHSHLVLTLRMYGAVPPLPHMPLWHAQRQLYLSHAARTILTQFYIIWAIHYNSKYKRVTTEISVWQVTNRDSHRLNVLIL